jgi:AcrR family transcriptional regulator
MRAITAMAGAAPSSDAVDNLPHLRADSADASMGLSGAGHIVRPANSSRWSVVAHPRRRARGVRRTRPRSGHTIRSIARRAKVDPSLVLQHYGSKAALFNSAIQLGEASPGEIDAHLHDVLDVRLAALPPETKALLRSMLTAPEATAQMSAFLNERAANLSRAMNGDDADLRAALTVSSILGLIIARHFLQLDAFARASDAEIARVARPWITTGVDPTTRQHSRTSTPAD